jgi:3-methyladenine DNA glycosylase/8-oxoguanine DNA glycosylase
LKFSEKWKPYRSLACWYLWRSVDKPAEKGRPQKAHRNAKAKKATAS